MEESEIEPRNPDGTYVMTKKRRQMFKQLEAALIDYKRVRGRLEEEKKQQG
jgi:hypothetical protein